MTTIFIAGSISINRLDPRVKARITEILLSGSHVVVGDADGADTSIQNFLSEKQAEKVTVYCSGDVPRNNIANWPVRNVNTTARAGTRAYFTAKDLEMARISESGLMIWDCKSTGTLGNVIELLKEKKTTAIFLENIKEFFTVSNNEDLAILLKKMSPSARQKAEEKMKLSKKVSNLRQDMFSLDVEEKKDIDTASSNQKVQKIKPSQMDGINLGGISLSGSATLRIEIVDALKKHVNGAHLNQMQAAEVFGVSAQVITSLLNEKVGNLDLDLLVNMATAAGLRIGIIGPKPHTVGNDLELEPQ